MPRTDSRDKLIQTALDLFYRDGFHAVGVDRIATESGIAKMTLYRHFRTKDDLILAALRRRDEIFRAWLNRAMELRSSRPEGRLLAVFDAMDDWFHGKGPGRGPFLGCAFVKASAEYGEQDNPIHRSAAEHKALLLRQTTELARDAGAAEPEKLARQLSILREGAVVEAFVSGDLDAAKEAKRVAKPLIEAAIARA